MGDDELTLLDNGIYSYGYGSYQFNGKFKIK